MEVLAPIDGPEQVPLLILAGATEIYCGYIPDDWRSTYNHDIGPTYPIQLSPNRRESRHSNLVKIDDLVKTVALAHGKGVPVYVTVNAPYYTQQSYPYMVSFCRHVLESGADGLIIADPGLIVALREDNVSTRIILSTCTQVASIPAVEFFLRLGVDRITFPRHVTLSEVRHITTAWPDIEYEVFILEGRCTYDDGNCHVLHCGGSLCMDEFCWDIWLADGSEPDKENLASLRRLQDDYRRFSFPFANDLKCSTGWRNMGCGICALPFLMKHTNVSAVKIAGRGIDNLQKLKSLWLLRKAMTMAREGRHPYAIRELVSNNPDCEQECMDGYRCYFPDWRKEVEAR